MFKPYGEVSDHSLNKEKMFGFINLDYHTNVDKAKRQLDKEHILKMRFAFIPPAAIKVKYLAPCVYNKILEYAFSIFGDIELCQVMLDKIYNSTGEGIIQFFC